MWVSYDLARFPEPVRAEADSGRTTVTWASWDSRNMRF